MKNLTNIVTKGLIVTYTMLTVGCSKTEHVIPEKLQPDLEYLIPSKSEFARDKKELYSFKAKTRGRPMKGSTIYINFEGKTITDELWTQWYNYFHPGEDTFYCPPANLTQLQKDVILDQVLFDFAPFNVYITTSAAVFKRATGKKQEIVVTSNSFYPGVSGVAFSNSIDFILPSVAFVFPEMLYNHAPYIGKIVSHESGHTAGLRHQSLYDTACSLVDRYRDGENMGKCWNVQGVWGNGTTLGCTITEDGHQLLANKFGLR